MIRFIFRRILETIPVLWAVATITFFMLRLAPGGPFDDERQVSPEVLRTLQAHYGLDKPLMAQYGDYLLNLLKGDLGPSFKYPGRTVNEIIRDSFPNSMELGFYSMSIALALGLTLGIVASLKPNSILDYLPSSMAMVGICLPTFVLGPLLVLVFALKLQWFPYPGWDTPATKVLPSFTLGAYYAAYIARLTRGGMREILTQDFIRTARAKGLSKRATLWHHALRNALIPVLTIIGLQFSFLMAGAIIIEQVFFLPGLGRLVFQAITQRDLIVVESVVMLLVFAVIMVNFLVDLAYAAVDPRLRSEA